MTIRQNDCDLCWRDPEPWSLLHHEEDCQWFDSFSEPEVIESSAKYEPLALAPVVKGSHKWARYGVEGFGFGSYRSCTHALDPYVLSDGTTVYLSGSADRHARHWEPDFAVYLDSAWKPRTVAFHVGWPDYGLPLLEDSELAYVVSFALEQSRAGKTVEIGCIGSHGRTGTFVAMLEVVADPSLSGSDAVRRVRANHCHRAIETTDQEWFVSYFAAFLRNQKRPTHPSVQKRRDKRTAKHNRKIRNRKLRKS